MFHSQSINITQVFGITPISLSDCNSAPENVKFIANYIFAALADVVQLIWDLGKRAMSIFSSESKQEAREAVENFFRNPEESNSDNLRSIFAFLPSEDMDSASKASKQWNSFVKPLIIAQKKKEWDDYYYKLGYFP